MVFFLFQCDIESEGDTKVRRIVYTGNYFFDCFSTICFLLEFAGSKKYEACGKGA